jgi:hypothetical protein
MEAGGQASFLVEVNDPDAYDEFEVRIVNDLTRELSFTSAGRDTALSIGADTTGLRINEDLIIPHNEGEVLVLRGATVGFTLGGTSCCWVEDLDECRTMVLELLHMKRAGGLSHTLDDTFNIMHPFEDVGTALRFRELQTDNLYGRGTEEQQWNVLQGEL